MDKTVHSALKEIYSQGVNGLSLSHLWSRLHSSLSSNGLTVKRAVWSGLVVVSCLQFRVANGSEFDPKSMLPILKVLICDFGLSLRSLHLKVFENKQLSSRHRAIELDSTRKKVLDFVESRMVYIAPNLCAIVGSVVVVKLMGTTGGLGACNVQILGVKKKTLAGFSSATSQFRVGFMEQTEIFQSTPPPLSMRACRLLAAKSALAARIDSTRGDSTRSKGWMEFT